MRRCKVRPQRGRWDVRRSVAARRPRRPHCAFLLLSHFASAGPEASPLKPVLELGLDGAAARGPPLPGSDACGHVQRKPISWTKGELVGQGAFGSVCVAMDNDTGELIAVKQASWGGEEQWA